MSTHHCMFSEQRTRQMNLHPGERMNVNRQYANEIIVSLLNGSLTFCHTRRLANTFSRASRWRWTLTNTGHQHVDFLPSTSAHFTLTANLSSATSQLQRVRLPHISNICLVKNTRRNWKMDALDSYSTQPRSSNDRYSWIVMYIYRMCVAYTYRRYNSRL